MATAEVPGPIPATYLLAGGSYDKPLREVRPGFLSAALARTPEPAAKVVPAARRHIGSPQYARSLDHRFRESARGSSDRQSHLAGTLRPRSDRQRERLRHANGRAHASRAARLARPPIRRERLGHQGSAPIDHDVRGLSPGVVPAAGRRTDSPSRKNRRRKPPVLAPRPPPNDRGADSRFDPRRLRPA